MMSKFMDVPLTKEEEVILTSLIVDLAEENNTTNADILHELIRRANYYGTVEELKRICRKTKHELKQTSIRTSKAYIQAFGFEQMEKILNN